ncbi:MAG: efflux RND transporter periplasmic adaptor subunit [Myxococcales bacterium]|jgi:RND family efflux transporter MFP subunit
MKLNKKKILSIGAVLVVALYLFMAFRDRAEASDDLAKETLQQAVPTVSLTRAEPVDPKRTLTLPGNVAAWYEAEIFAQVSGYVKMWYKDYGAEVKKGDVLAEINAPALSAEYKQAKADANAERARYKLAVLTAKRYSAMRKSNAVPLQTINVKQALAQVAEKRLEAALQNVARLDALMKFTTIKAPFDGVVTSREINVGDYVNEEGTLDHNEDKSSRLFTVADIHQMRLFVSVPQNFGPFLKPGLTADVTVPQLPNRDFTAEFLTVAKGFSPNTRTAVTEFVIDNEDRALWPGSYATVRLSAEVEKGALTIPATALVFDEKGTQVATLTDRDEVHFQRISVTRILDSAVEVSAGVTTDDRIIDNPSAALLEGEAVRVVTPAPGYNLAPDHGGSRVDQPVGEAVSEEDQHELQKAL